MKYRKKKEVVEVFHLDHIDYETLKQLSAFCGKVKFEICNLTDSEPLFEVYDAHGYIGKAYEGCYLVKQYDKIQIFTKALFDSKFELDFEMPMHL